MGTLIDLETWSRTATSDGLELWGPDGDVHVRVRPRVAAKPARALIAESALAFGIGDLKLEELDRVVTRGGELGVFARGAGVASAGVAGAAGLADFAFSAVGDQLLLCIDGVGSASADVAGAVSVLSSFLGPGRGCARTRMFEYQPPPFWRATRRDHASVFFHPLFPRVQAQLVVHDARPFTSDPVERTHRQLFIGLSDAVIEDLSDPKEIVSSDGLLGRCRTARVGATRRAVAALSDQRFVYQATAEWLDTPATADVPTIFAELVQSFCSLPHRPDAEAMPIWA